MTTVYFIRHAQPDYTIKDDVKRPLTEKGLADRLLVTQFLSNKEIDIVYSSPYQRVFDTISDFAEKTNLSVELMDDFRERKVGNEWIEDFKTFASKQWSDFDYKLSDGESLHEVQKRNIKALNQILVKHENKNIVIATHGTALSTIINYYDNSYGYEDFNKMVHIMPWAVKIIFHETNCAGMEKIDLFNCVSIAEAKKPDIYTAPLHSLKAYKFVVIFAQYQDKWLYCRHKNRNVYETAGGHIENGETPLEAAKRELFEETGAIKYDILPAFDYSVHRENGFSNVQLFLARIKELSDMPDYEMSEVKLFDSIPDKMRFPLILPVLYSHLQCWLNLQCSKGELWDIYNKERMLTGRTHERGIPLDKGDYHLVVHVWTINDKGEYLITKRSPNKGYPYMWETSGGSALAGDDSITAAIREAKEETGILLSPHEAKCMFTLKGENYFCDVWLFRHNSNINEVTLQENETCDAKYADEKEIRRMINTGEFLNYDYIEDIFAVSRIFFK